MSLFDQNQNFSLGAGPQDPWSMLAQLYKTPGVGIPAVTAPTPLIPAVGGIGASRASRPPMDFSSLINPPSRHLSMSGNMIDPKTGVEAGNPFDSGFFKGAAGRAQVERNTLSVDPTNPINGYTGASPAERLEAIHQTQAQTAGMPGILPVGSPGRVVADPFGSNGAPLPGVDLGNLVAPSNAPYAAPANTAPGMYQGQINSALPPDQRYQDANYWTALIKQKMMPMPTPSANPAIIDY